MVINEDTLFKYGAEIKNFAKNNVIFDEGGSVKNYYQIQKGIVKICNIFDDGKEFVHGFPFAGHCFGESYLYTEKPYGITASTISPSGIIVLPDAGFLQMVEENPEILLAVNRYTAERLHFRYLISSFLAITDPMIRIQKLLDYLKQYFDQKEPYSFQVPFTRNNLAGLTGLRIETIIRVIKKMQAMQLLKIENGKIYY
ncbi:hypothetical protein ASG01_02715 [Chryseobacterium sp. Leaf180]|uniref:Crp/Fnr family transcriptional regulator n=1 Tax=Chryseobacterium sp. Leaf180 TaxID=1736289 RepID=UPI0006FF6E3E|nr:Crp/Fnr family transcriptional regulator [Chryseobacterium sp. Leaf180]KQR94798.1 hypothetical protein ASG01_02715 [Chryseobacterium sp. Leaf180]